MSVPPHPPGMARRYLHAIMPPHPPGMARRYPPASIR